ncbi:hypothetical protein LTR37_019752 [Vermiconidia calcicola]|uniref:Uncharacterized protein n=1 Tax=Vermiconidia calcicola TaxID=1690605 RepID=A0ACC3MD86_9PEZI|nr:hypothetical protein LTR37_019752 [Vermiconidia calcicola]
MAPDINSLPASPRAERAQTSRTYSNTASRRPSQQMLPPLAPAATASHYIPTHRSPVLNSNEVVGLPLRHPRPLTAAELYLECEKEQEAVVNRLTRELTALRAQTASVTSNTSHSSTSTSASLLPIDISDPNPTHQMTGATHPTPSRRHRSSSSLSTRSIPNTPSTSVSATGSGTTNMSTQAQAGTAGAPGHGVSQASADRTAAAGGPGGNLSRQPSITASGTSTPARQSLDIPRPSVASYTLPHRPSLSRDPSYISQATTASSTAAHAGTPSPLSPAQSVTTPHYADTAAYRSEMEIVKAENDSLRQRVRALERALQARRRDSSNSDVARPDLGSTPRMTRDRESFPSPTTHFASLASPEPRSSGGVAAWAGSDGGVGGVAPPRERSESQSTTASSRRGMVVEDEVRFGESAGSVGTGRGM